MGLITSIFSNGALHGFVIAIDHAPIRRGVIRVHMRIVPGAPGCEGMRLLVSVLVSFRVPDYIVSSTSTGPEKGADAPFAHASRSLCSMNHAVFCVTPRSRCNFVLEAPFTSVVSK